MPDTGRLALQLTIPDLPGKVKAINSLLFFLEKMFYLLKGEVHEN
jgi:hypothetical protein